MAKLVIWLNKKDKFCGTFSWDSSSYDDSYCLDALETTKGFIDHYNKYLASSKLHPMLFALRMFEKENEDNTLDCLTVYPKISKTDEWLFTTSFSTKYKKRNRYSGAGLITSMNADPTVMRQDCDGFIFIQIDKNYITTEKLFESLDKNEYCRKNKIKASDFDINNYPIFDIDPFRFAFNEIGDFIEFLKEYKDGFRIKDDDKIIYCPSLT